MRPLLAIAVFLGGCIGMRDATVIDDGGSPPPVDSPMAKYPDVRTFWARSVARTCGPNNGVCHDNRQFPDLQTASGLLDAVNQRCNQIRSDPRTIDNLCEPVGDSLWIGGFSSRIGTVTVAPGATPASLTLGLRDAIPAGTSGAVVVVRNQPGLGSIKFPIPAAAVMSSSGSSVKLAYAVLADPKQAPGPGGTPGAPAAMAGFLAPAVYTPGNQDQIEVGDPNGDGIFGADLGGALIKPGAPLQSYLFLRVLAPLKVGSGNRTTNVMAPASTEAQMPIANFQYWDVDNSLQALWCWIAGMKADGSNADGPIDYTGCDLTQMPSPTHQGGEATTFSSVYANILAPNCSACHHPGSGQATTFYIADLQSTYDTLLGIHGAGPSENRLGLPYVTRSDPTKSYLYLKVAGDPRIDGARMPFTGALRPEDLSAINTWISQGANND